MRRGAHSISRRRSAPSARWRRRLSSGTGSSHGEQQQVDENAKRGRSRHSLAIARAQAASATFALPPAALTAPVYSIADRRRLVEQLTLALGSFYVHLERKKAIFGFDPVRSLGLLAPKVETISNAEFHESLVELLARVRDRRVIFLGRSPYGSAAMVPFTVETCWEHGVRLYVVTRLDPGAKTKTLQPGARVSHRKGVPIDRCIRLNANLFDGGNEAAALARSLAFLTHRPISRFGLPLEAWFDLRFTLNGVGAEERFDRTGFTPATVPAYPSLGRNFTGSAAIGRLWTSSTPGASASRPEL